MSPLLMVAGIQVYPLRPLVDEQVIPESEARPCTHSAVCAPEGSDVQEPPTALHVSSQFPPAADIYHCLPVPPQSSSGSHPGGYGEGGCGGGGEGCGGGGGRSGGALGDTPSHGQKRW